MVTKPQLSAFSKSLVRSYNRSQSSTKTNERRTFSQSPTLKPFTHAERTGQPLKAAAWRE